MGSEEVSLKTHWLVRLVALILVLSGLAELLGGGYLIALGGSWYYALAGAGTLAAGVLLWRGRLRGVFVYLIVFALTVVWSLMEVGFTFWPSVPRLVAPIAVCAVFWINMYSSWRCKKT